jgi:DNA-binding response OmpR family regulator
MSACSILIVEDDPGAADAFVPMLVSRGYDVRIAVNGEAGFREIERRVPAVMLVDLHLPDVDGVEFLRVLRRNAAHADIPVAIVTGDYLVDDRMILELKTLDAELYFKPLWEDDLVDVVERLLLGAAEFSAAREKVRTAEAGC